MGCPELKQLVRAATMAAALSACGGGGGGDGTPPPPAPPPTVTLSWNANRESAVNRPGGGYEVAISGQAVIDVPYVSGPAAPTTVTVTLTSGTYTATVRAYAALDANGGTGRTFSAPHVATVVVP